MLNMTGQLINVFKSPKGTNKQGEEYGGQDKLQVLGEVELPNGETRMEMFTLTTHNLSKFEQFVNQKISFSVGAIAIGRNINFYIPKGTTPTAV